MLQLHFEPLQQQVEQVDQHHDERPLLERLEPLDLLYK